MDTNDVLVDGVLGDDPSHIITRALLATTTESADLEDPGELGK